MVNERPKRTFNVYIRDIIVHDDHDPGPAKGEFEIVFGAAGTPVSASARSQVEWKGSVSSHRTYDVAQWTGAVAVPAEHGKLTVAGGGIERDSATRGDELRGGLATFATEQEWGEGKWWRTTNGRDFDFTFCVTPAEESSEAARPVWSGETYDAPGPDKPGISSYRGVLSE